jgi:uncharacterized membrane protein (UPF0182 family)
VARVIQFKGREKPRPPRKAGRRGRVIAWAVAGVVFVVAALAVYFTLYVDWLWYGEVHLRNVFWTTFWWRIFTGLGFGVVFFVILYGNIEIARRLSPRYRAFEGIDVVEYVNERAARLTRRVGLAAALVIGALVGLSTSSGWLTVLRALHGVSFGRSDPIFHHDYSLYVFGVPFWNDVYGLLVAALITALIAATIVHVALGGMLVQRAAPAPPPEEPPAPQDPFARLRGRPTAPVQFSLRPQGVAIAHLSALLAALFLVVGAGYILKAWDYLVSAGTVVAGAGYTDVHAGIPGARIMMVLAWVIAVLLIVNVWRRRWRWPAYAIGGWIVLALLVRVLFPAVMQWLVVNPSQQAREHQYIGYNIAATRAAYKLDAISQTQYPLQGDLNAAKLTLNSGTIRNIRLWDPRTLLTSYGALQELRPYYSFTDVDVDRYDVNGVYRETMLSAREMNIAGLPQQNQTWVNQHLVYTHGFGAVVSAVNQVASDGSPDFLVENVPPTSSATELQIAQPRIYFGEIGSDYTLVKTKAPEFDYPGGAGDVFTQYTGSAGIPIGSLWNQLAFSFRFGTINILATKYIDGDSRIIIRNNIKQRLHAAAPFLTFDHDPYMVIAGGRLYWVADAYTTTSQYPYSQPQGGINYVRNSVKAVIDAYSGTMKFFIADPSDPIIQTYEKIFPGMFTPMSQMPAALVAHLRYPEDFFNVQSQLFTTYHVTDPDVLYNKSDQWAIPTGTSLSSASGQMEPYYVIMRLPGQTREEFVLILPFVPNGRQNMVGWLAAESDVPNYGKAVSFNFPKNATVYGPAQVESAINQDPDISSQRTLLGQQGSRVIFGNLLVMPIEDSLLYVQPFYLESTTSDKPLPQLKRVIVFYRATTDAGITQLGGQQKVVMTPTLADSLTAIFGAAPAAAGPGAGQTAPPTTTQPGPGPAAGIAKLIARANAEFEAAQTALKGGDFAEYGRQIAALQVTLQKLKALK